ncbi:MAG: hypothetical protein D4S01_09295 [Dehalococcoidia bacterium]|nr:MAG: hypothetical protein D4S01_09295 [Dehalococcoidia bacterium]
MRKIFVPILACLFFLPQADAQALRPMASALSKTSSGGMVSIPGSSDNQSALKALFDEVLALNGSQITDSKNEHFILGVRLVASKVYPIFIEILRTTDRLCIGTLQFNIKEDAANGVFALSLGLVDIIDDTDGAGYQKRGIFPRVLSIITTVMPDNAEIHLSSLEETESLKELAAGASWENTRMGKIYHGCGWQLDVLCIYGAQPSEKFVLFDRGNRYPELYIPESFKAVLNQAIVDIDRTDIIDGARVSCTMSKIRHVSYPVYVRDVITHAGRLSKKGIEVRIADNVPDQVIFGLSEEDLQLIINELIYNAKDASPTGISVGITIEANTLIIKVNDQGRGIDFQKLTDILLTASQDGRLIQWDDGSLEIVKKGWVADGMFESRQAKPVQKEQLLAFVKNRQKELPFIRGLSEKSGPGIGLCAVREHVRSTSGHIFYTTGPKGTMFTVMLPLIKASSAGVLARSALNAAEIDITAGYTERFAAIGSCA